MQVDPTVHERKEAEKVPPELSDDFDDNADTDTRINSWSIISSTAKKPSDVLERGSEYPNKHSRQWHSNRAVTSAQHEEKLPEEEEKKHEESGESVDTAMRRRHSTGRTAKVDSE